MKGERGQAARDRIMPLNLNISGRVICARLAGELDHHGARALREEIDAAITRVQPELLELDFSSVTFMDSSGIGLIMGRCRAMEEYGGVVRISGVSAQLRKVLRLSGIDRIAEIDGAHRAQPPREASKKGETCDETDE